MATTKKDSKKKANRGSRKGSKQTAPRVDLRGPWKPSWYVLWGFITVIGEIILIFTIKSKGALLSNLQDVVIFVAIPFVAHLIVSGIRTILFAISA